MIALFSLMMAFTACNSCKKETKQDDTTKVVTGPLVLENVLSSDKEYMFMNYGEDYRWYESCIVLKDFLDDETCDGTVESVANVFQVLVEKEKGVDTQVVLTAHTPDTTAIEVKKGFWVEDFPMNDENIKVTFKEAFQKIQEVNSPKPHSRQVVLRKEVGPVAANPQYIFGNVKAQLYVDAVTGDVTDKDPCFPKGFTMPLGEWP